MPDISSKNKSADDNEDEEGKSKTNRYLTIQILILNRMIAYLIYSGNYFDLFYF